MGLKAPRVFWKIILLRLVISESVGEVAKMPARFPIERDDEFYVFLKSSLGSRYRIESEPSKSYYSEWLFHYTLYDGDTLLLTFEGDYRSVEKGTLISKAISVLDELEAIDA